MAPTSLMTTKDKENGTTACARVTSKKKLNGPGTTNDVGHAIVTATDQSWMEPKMSPLATGTGKG